MSCESKKPNNANRYLVVTTKTWNIDAFHQQSEFLPGRWILITEKEDLTAEKLAELSPRYVFFPHWSWIVPKEIADHYECVCLHMTDLPFGRGGSPLQNLIVRGHTKTKVSALRMTNVLDGGPIYAKRDLDLHGAAFEIFDRFAQVSYDLIRWIVENEPEPEGQQGEVVEFERRKPEDSEIDFRRPKNELYDFIRMLDAPSYPRAYTRIKEKRFELSSAKLEEGKLSFSMTLVDDRHD